jgi:hypothetical protein
LPLGAERPDPGVGPVLVHKTIELRPRYLLQKSMQNAIVVAHGVDPSSCPNHRQVFELV